MSLSKFALERDPVGCHLAGVLHVLPPQLHVNEGARSLFEEQKDADQGEPHLTHSFINWRAPGSYLALAGGTMLFIRRYSTIWP